MRVVRHINIPVFIPHEGCPNQCVFCNQRVISGTNEFDDTLVKEQIMHALDNIPCGCDTEIAYFGGSFTGLGEKRICNLLSIAQGFVDSGRVQSIRFSTRPDYISEDIIRLIAPYTIRTIELGLQSMNDDVLALSERGHTSLQSVQAVQMLKRYSYKVIGQMMLGLPGANCAADVESARIIADMGVDGARVYPTLVFKDTALAEMYHSGRYIPLTVKEAAKRAKQIVLLFRERSIPVIRLGLCASDDFHKDSKMIAGPYHEAFGELVEGEIIYDRLCVQAEKYRNDDFVLRVHPSDVSKVIGHRQSNKNRLIDKYNLHSFKIVSDDSCERI